MPTSQDSKTKKSPTQLIAWILCTTFSVLGLVVFIRYSELARLLVVCFSLAFVSFVWALIESQRSHGKKAVLYSTQSSLITISVVGIVIVLNFIGYRYTAKKDFTKAQVHSLSDQSKKIMQGLTKDITATFFAPIQDRERFRALLESYRDVNRDKFKLEYLDPNREVTRAQAAGIKVATTLVLSTGGRTEKVTDLSEEKITNGLIKVTKEKSSTLCAITGHGEKSFVSKEADGYALVKQGLVDQSAEVRDINIISENGKIPAGCDAIAIVGTQKPLLLPEVKALEEYLGTGGRALVAVDVDIKGTEPSPELLGVLQNWGIQVKQGLVVDPASRMAGLDASAPLLVQYSRDHAITKEIPANMASFMPFMRPVMASPSTPTGVTVSWLAQTTPVSFLVTDFKQLATGQVSAQGATKGPFNGAMIASGKFAATKAQRETRLVVLGTSAIGQNRYVSTLGNFNFLLNAFSWVLEDDNLISIREKEDMVGKVEMTAIQSRLIGLFSIVLIPLSIFLTGVFIWMRRKKL